MEVSSVGPGTAPVTDPKRMASWPYRKLKHPTLKYSRGRNIGWNLNLLWKSFCLVHLPPHFWSPSPMYWFVNWNVWIETANSCSVCCNPDSRILMVGTYVPASYSHWKSWFCCPTAQRSGYKTWSSPKMIWNAAFCHLLENVNELMISSSALDRCPHPQKCDEKWHLCWQSHQINWTSGVS